MASLNIWFTTKSSIGEIKKVVCEQKKSNWITTITGEKGTIKIDRVCYWLSW
jgi:hypothetical protein